MKNTQGQLNKCRASEDDVHSYQPKLAPLGYDYTSGLEAPLGTY